MLSFKVTVQGKPRVKETPPRVVADGPTLIAAEIDMHSKWCEVDCVGSDEGGLMVGVGANDRSNHLDEADESDTTIISFPDHRAPEWDVFAAVCNRYTLRVVLTRNA